MSEFKNCPYCGEQILAKAIKCKHCLSMLDDASAVSLSTSDQSASLAAQPQPAPEKTAATPPPDLHPAPEPFPQPSREYGAPAFNWERHSPSASGEQGQPSAAPPPPVNGGFQAAAPPPPVNGGFHAVAPPPAPAAPSSQAAYQPGNQAAAVYPKAPVGKRILAYIIDGVIGGLPLAILAPLCVIPFIRHLEMASYSYNFSPGAGTIILFALGMLIGGGWAIFYTLTRDGFGRGQSIGKKATGLMVVRLSDNRPCTKGNSAVRNVFAMLIALILGWIPVLNFIAAWVEPVVALIHGQGFRLGDMVAKTQVIEAGLYRG